MSPKDKGPALIIGIGKPKKGDEDMEEGSPEEEASESPEEEKREGDDRDMHLDAAFDAIKSGDRDAFKEAMKSCLMANDERAYEE